MKLGLVTLAAIGLAAGAAFAAPNSAMPNSAMPSSALKAEPAAMPPAGASAPSAADAYSHRVAVLQASLDSAGANLPVDGRWAPRTVTALRNYQRKHGLTVTGRLDTPTWHMLDPIG